MHGAARFQSGESSPKWLSASIILLQVFVPILFLSFAANSIPRGWWLVCIAHLVVATAGYVGVRTRDLRLLMPHFIYTIVGHVGLVVSFFVVVFFVGLGFAVPHGFALSLLATLCISLPLGFLLRLEVLLINDILAKRFPGTRLGGGLHLGFITKAVDQVVIKGSWAIALFCLLLCLCWYHYYHAHFPAT